MTAQKLPSWKTQPGTEKLQAVLSGKRLQEVKEQIKTYAKSPKGMRKDPAHLMRDRAGVIVAASNDDYGPKERHRHDVVEKEGEAAQAHVRIVTATVLDTMKSRKNLGFDKDEDQQRLWNAGDRLRSDFYLAGMQPRVISTLTPLPGGGKGEMSNRMVDARNRFNAALNAVGPVLSPILLHVVCHDQPVNSFLKRKGSQSETVASTLFKAALATLTHHYGY